jgi:diadenosine tetraphosphatase ApaH/serine/threonine PP2A family protein phosphatase
MRYAVISDIHANQEALQTVLSELASIARRTGEPFDGLWCLGDLVGYGPEPGDCVDLVRAHTDVVIAGNHDRAVAGMLSVEQFNDSAQVTADWTRDRLSEEHLRYLSELSERMYFGDCTLVHGSPRHPIWEYLTSPEGAQPSFSCFSSQFCLVGHTHVPSIFLQREAASEPVVAGRSRPRRGRLIKEARLLDEVSEEETLRLLAVEQEAIVRQTMVPGCEMLLPGEGLWAPPAGCRAIINPGSVGQPRDNDPRAAFLVYDTERGFEFYRIAYPIEQTQRKIWRSGLPARMAVRLTYGL